MISLVASALLLPGLLAPPPPRPPADVVVAKRNVQGTVDGLAGANEYPVSVPIPGFPGATMQVQTYRNAAGTDEEIQFLFTVPDAVFSANDLIWIYLDGNDDNDSMDPVDRQIEIKRNGAVTIGGVTANSPPSGAAAFPGAQVLVTSNPANWVAEIKLESVNLAMNGIPAHLGLRVKVLDTFNGTEGTYPAGSSGATPSTWDTLKTRYPIDYMIVLDYSGSMLTDSKWTHAKNAAGFFRSTMAALGDPGFFADRVGLVTFAWNCSGANTTTTAKPLATPAVGVYPTGVVDPVPNNCTPIGEGLEAAFLPANLNASVNDAMQQKDRGVLLLSDGLQNRPNPTFTPAETTYDPCAATPGWDPCPAATESNVPVSTVALGEDWSVDTDLLQDVQERYLGAFRTDFDLATDPEAIKETFINGLEDYYGTNLLSSGPPAAFMVDPNHDRLVVIASWAAPANAVNIELRNGGVLVPCGTASSDTGVGLGICVVESPPQGASYEVKAVGGGAFATAPTTVFVVADLQLRARFSVDPVNVGTGDAMLLTAQLRDGGQPVLNAPPGNPVRARVRIQTPEEGVGTFATVHDPACKRRDPVLPRPDPQGGQSTRGQMAAGTSMTGAAAAGTPDPQPPLYALVSQLLDACGRTGLGRGDEGLEMRDDATQGDATAGDGVYSLTYTPQTEGSYVFRFDVEGTTAAGHPFTRTRRMARYVRVQPAPAASPAGSRLVQQGGGLAIAEYWVLPRDRFGGYTGPGRARHVDFVVQGGGGTFAGPVIDYGNGYYARRVSYDPSQGAPVVTPTVNGEPLAPIGPGLGGPGGTGGPGGGRLELGVFAAYTGFDDALGLDDGPGLGARVGFALIPALTLEGEGAVTWTENAGGESGQMLQLLGSARLDLSGGAWETFVRAGAGQVYFRGFTAEDDAFAYHGGAGFTLWLGSLGLRGDARALRIGEVGTAGATTSWQGQAGVVIRF